MTDGESGPEPAPAAAAPAKPGRRWPVVLGVIVVVALVAALLVRRLGADDEPDANATTSTTTTTAPAPVEGEPGAAGVGDPYYPGAGNGGYDVDHYTLDLTWLADEAVLEGITTVDAVATQDLSTFHLDLSGMDVSSVTVGGEPATVPRDDRELVIEPPEDIADGTEFTTVVTYRGTPEPISEGSELVADLGWNIDGREVYVISEPTGAQTFFPVNNHPTDKATYTLRVTAPADQTVAANGLLAADEDNGDGTRSWTYEATDQMASYLVQIAIGDYELVDGGKVGDVTIRHALHRSLGPVARDVVAGTAEMITLLDDVFGPYPFEAYGVVAVDEALGFALETQTLTIIGSDLAVLAPFAQQVLLHELAHQWVGDTVSTATWQDIWLNEGFATYAEWLWLERTDQRSAADAARQFEGASELDAPPPGDPGPEELFTPTVYYRGGMTLQALRERVGDDAFFDILLRWVDEHRDSTASTDQLIALAEEVSGEDLDALFQDWLYEVGLPAL